MFLWKYVDLDPIEVNTLKKIYLDHLPQSRHFFQTLDLGIKEFAGRPVFKTVLIIAQPNSVGVIHKDYRPHDNNQLAINIPLQNCDNAVTEFWETNDTNQSIEYSSSGSPFIGHNRNQCKKLDGFRLTKPVVFRTDIPHSVDNFSDQLRLAISLRLVNDPWDLTI